MKLHKWDDLKKRSKLSPEQHAAIEAEVAREITEMNLREVRELAGKTQVEVAHAAEIAQGELSRLERRDDHLVSTLRRYVEALGGELEIVVRFGDRSVRLRGV